MDLSVLISGAGIAGPTLAFWLSRQGMRPTIVEQAPRPRSGGYVIDFWGVGYEVAERMGLIEAVREAGYQVRELRIVNARGRRVGGFDVRVIREIAKDRYTSLPRSELARILLDAAGAAGCELIFGDSIESMEEHGGGVDARFRHAPPRTFDIVIGADGLHSRVRRLAWGPGEQFERRLGYTVAAFEVRGYRPRDEDAYVAYSLPGRQAARFAMRDDRTLFLFVAAAEHLADVDPHDRAAQERALERAYGGAGWECREMLEAMRHADDIYLDRVEQIVMPRWSKGRVALLGDAAFCPSLLAGEGSGMAMAGAYVLAGELSKNPLDHGAAFDRYESFLRKFVDGKQKSAAKFGASFAPRTGLGVWFRNWASRLCNVPGLGRAILAGSLVDDIRLPEYPCEGGSAAG